MPSSYGVPFGPRVEQFFLAPYTLIPPFVESLFSSMCYLAKRTDGGRSISTQAHVSPQKFISEIQFWDGRPTEGVNARRSKRRQKNVCIVSDFSGRIRRSLKSESRHGRDRFEIHGQDIHGQYLKHGLVYFTSRLNQILVYKYYEVSFYALKERHTLV